MNKSMNNKEKKISYDLLGERAPQMPKKLPAFLEFAVSNAPKHTRAALVNSIFPPLGALMHNVKFCYPDGRLHEPHFFAGLVGPMAVGKGAIDPIIESIIRSLRAHDDASYDKLNEWQRQVKSAGANKQKPTRPEDAAILVPPADMTNPALIQLLMSAEKEGNRFLYTTMPEVDLLDQCSGGHKKVTGLIRLGYDLSHYGAQRATADGVSGNPILRWNFNFSCVESKAQTFFKGYILDGTVSRISISYLQRPEERIKGIPRQKEYDEAYNKRMDEWLVRLQSATGIIPCPKAGKLADELKEEMSLIAELSDDDNFDDMTHRAVALAWLKACLLYVLNDYSWSKEIADFMRWSLYYDLWSKIALFGGEMSLTGKEVNTKTMRKHGPANMLILLGDSFSADQLKAIRIDMGKDPDPEKQLNTWISRGFITYCAQTGLYTKTEAKK